MKDTIKVSEEFRDYLEGLYYEKNSRSDLLVFMLSQDMSNEEMFKKIHTEYQEFFIQYEAAKEMLEILYLAPEYKLVQEWKLDFRSGEIIIYAE